jgi:RNA polymerase sigma-70 factor (ECF subfamily)
LEQVAHDPRVIRLVPSIRADLLRRAGRPAEALAWYRKALTTNGSEPGRNFLRRRIVECGG